MKKLILFLTALFLITGCSSDDSNNGNNSFVIELEPSTTESEIDKHFTIEINSEDEIKEMWVSLDNFATGGFTNRNFGKSYTLNFYFDTLGEKTISIKAKNQSNQISEKQVTVNVIRGNSIKINGVQIVSFDGIDTALDPEYSDTDPNRLADLVFTLQKIRYVGGFYENDSGYDWRFWYKSIVLENQGNLTWDCSNDNLYINLQDNNPFLKLRFALFEQDFDSDNNENLNFLIDTLYSDLDINFADYYESKPSVIAYSFPEYSLEFKLFVDWAD